MTTRDPSVFVHEEALCESDEVGPRTRVWAFGHVMKGARAARCGPPNGCDLSDATARTTIAGAMRPPFPGMDPWLEHPTLWPDVHNSLIAALRDALASLLCPRYYVAIEERIYSGPPEGLSFVGDASVVRDARRPYRSREEAGILVEVPLPMRVRETFLSVRTVGKSEVVTLLEVLSHSNKRPGRGRSRYEAKRLAVFGSPTHLVEVDLLREWEPMQTMGADARFSYRILVSRAERRPQAQLLGFDVREPVPSFRLPLRPGDDEPEVDLGALLHALYERAHYELRIDYHREPVPPLSDSELAWARSLQGHGNPRLRT